MDWFIINEVKEGKTIINASSILKVHYNEETNLTIIDFNRGAYPSVYVRGNIMTDIRRLLSAHGHYVSQIGEL